MDAAQQQRNISDASLANLKPHNFQPGQSGNPGGRPKGRSLTAIIREVLDSNTIKGKPLPEGRTVADVLAEVFVAEALKGKFPFAKEVIDRADGKVVDKVEIEDNRKAYVTESPDTLWPSDPNNDRTSHTEPREISGET
jgi:hypothetical protein